MSDLPHNTGRPQPGGVVDAPSATESTVPAWLAVRRARVSAATLPRAEVELEVEFESISEAETSVPEESSPPPIPSPADARNAPEVGAPNSNAQFIFSRPSSQRMVPATSVSVVFPTAAPVPPPLPTVEMRPTVAVNPDRAMLPLVPARARDVQPAEVNSVKARIVRWARSASMVGALLSFLIHAVALSVLAVVVIGGTRIHQAPDIVGLLGDPNGEISDIEFDSAMPGEPGEDAAAPQFPDMVQLASTEAPAFDPSDAIRGTGVGTGRGNGQGGGGGDGESMTVPAVNIPKYAVTKGSYSAWTEPRDPGPGISYEIVIQFRLPANVKTYRGSDLSGMVTGTDGYKQAIKFNRGQAFDVQDGSVQVRIRVPGAAQLVRDTIRIESKLLREKQMIEIEF